jgi:hypothetical protein
MDVVVSNSLDKPPAHHTVLTPVGDYYHQILTCLGYPLMSPPVADLLRQLYGLSGQWLVVSPLFWEATHNDAQVVAMGDELGLSSDQGRVCFELFAEHARHYFPQCLYHDATTWLIQVDGCPEVSAKPIQFMRQQSLFPQLASMDNSGFWQRVLTEVQMLFNQAQSVTAEGYPINGIWVWGQGRLELPGSRIIQTDSDTTYQLGSLLSTQVAGISTRDVLPDSALLLLEHVSTVATIQSTIDRRKINWYWANGGYQTRPKPWFKRIWGALC